MARPLRIDWQDGDRAEALRQAYRAEAGRHVRVRSHALGQVRAGSAVPETAALVGVHEVTVQQWRAWYRRGGLAEVRRHRLGGMDSPPA